MTQNTLSINEVAERLRVHRDTVTRWMKAGTLPYFRLPGGQYRIRISDVEALEQSTSREAHPAGGAA
ncbi:MAG: helix-turn-helix domain-containing protein [Actinomycetota bacterium]